jgi:murein DD-endopeptidase MepM/ murein hydrolase activator NlpD
MLRDGRRLFVPGVERDKRGSIKRPPSARERRALVIAKRLGLGTRTAAGRLLHGRVEARWIRAAEPAGRFRGTLRWPVSNGWFVRGFGSGEGGYHKAMDIMGKMGWNVRAAAPGIVGYSGNEIPGFGNMKSCHCFESIKPIGRVVYPSSPTGKCVAVTHCRSSLTGD